MAQKALMGKGRKRKVASAASGEEGGPAQPAIYRWKAERKR